MTNVLDPGQSGVSYRVILVDGLFPSLIAREAGTCPVHIAYLSIDKFVSTVS